jgi:hypothetical protein
MDEFLNRPHQVAVVFLRKTHLIRQPEYEVTSYCGSTDTSVGVPRRPERRQAEPVGMEDAFFDSCGERVRVPGKGVPELWLLALGRKDQF